MTSRAAACWSIDRARNGRFAIRRPDGGWAESRFAPDTDADRRMAEAGVRPGDRVLVLGGGAGELPAAALRACAPGGAVVVAEPHPGIHAAVSAALERVPTDSDLAACWTAPGLTRQPPPPADLASFLATVMGAGPFDRIVIHPHLALPPGFEALEQRLADFETRRRSGHRFRGHVEANILANRTRFLSSPGVRELEGLLPGEDIVVAGGGPSLTALAAAIGPCAHWIAVGTALGALDAAGIRPALAVITDPQPMVARSLVSLAPSARPPLVAFPSTAALAVEAALQLVAAFPEGEGGRDLEPLRAEVGELPAGGTVVTTAIGLAWLLGASRIFLAGVDLVETSTRSHADGSPHAAERLAGLARFGSLEERARARGSRLESLGDAIEVQTSGGGWAVSRRNLEIYGRALADLVRRRPEIPVIQLNPGALAIPGIACDPSLRPLPPRRDFTVPSGGRTRENGGLLCA